jgi:PadR family transcriptional regulator AphA
MKLENLLLGVLAQHPSTGYDLKKYMDTHGRFLRSNTQMSQVYRSLATMEQNEWVEHSLRQRAGATDAKVYSVTDEGATVFLDWLTGPYSPPSRFEDPEFGARLVFSGFMTRAQLLRLLDTELDVRRDEIARYRGRDRREAWAPTVEFDEGLAELVAEWAHRRGSAAKDAHVAGVAELRDILLDTPEGADLAAVAGAWVAAHSEVNR